MKTRNAVSPILAFLLALVVAVGVAPQAPATETLKGATLSIARGSLQEKGLKWDNAQVNRVSDTKAWVTVAPDQKQFGGGAEFYRVAVDTDHGVATVQKYVVSKPYAKSGVAHAKLYADGELFWSGSVSKDGVLAPDPDSPKVDTTRTRGVCKWAMNAICGTGGGAACYGACIGVGLASGPGGLGCAAVCRLISALGCSAATKKVCG